MKVQKRGFTMIELLVVVSIIVILGLLVLTAVLNGRKESRDVARATTTEQLALALRLYKEASGEFLDYPNGVEIGVGNSIDTEIAPFIQNIPVDPLAGEPGYGYWFYSNFDCGGEIHDVIVARTMELDDNGNFDEVCGGVTVQKTTPKLVPFAYAYSGSGNSGTGGSGSGAGGSNSGSRSYSQSSYVGSGSCTMSASPSSLTTGSGSVTLNFSPAVDSNGRLTRSGSQTSYNLSSGVTSYTDDVRALSAGTYTYNASYRAVTGRTFVVTCTGNNRECPNGTRVGGSVGYYSPVYSNVSCAANLTLTAPAPIYTQNAYYTQGEYTYAQSGYYSQSAYQTQQAATLQDAAYIVFVN